MKTKSVGQPKEQQKWRVFNNGAENTKPDGTTEIWGSIVLPDSIIGLLPLEACERIVAAHNASLGDEQKQ